MAMTRKRWLTLAAVSVPLLAAAVGLHTPAGRALLGAGGCPWGKGAPSAEKVEELRVKSAATLKPSGATRATARPAFGFVLDQSTRAEVTAWAVRASATCSEEIGGAALRCELAEKNVTEESGVAVRDAFFRFDPRGVVVGIDLMRDGTDGGRAAVVLATISERIAREAGPPTTTRGTADSTHLAGYLDRAATEFRFADYAADVSATNLGERGVVIREQYRSIPN
ncbi:hypothetical protein BH11MYX4_BH11MYX4_27770 [soil metagenome]